MEWHENFVIRQENEFLLCFGCWANESELSWIACWALRCSIGVIFHLRFDGWSHLMTSFVFWILFSFSVFIFSPLCLYAKFIDRSLWSWFGFFSLDFGWLSFERNAKVEKKSKQVCIDRRGIDAECLCNAPLTWQLQQSQLK